MQEHHSTVKHRLLQLLPRRTATAALLAALAGCGDNIWGPIVTPTPNTLPGYAIDCTPLISDDPLVCIPQDDWTCGQADYYLRKSICAGFFDGTPSDYVGDKAPEMSEYDADGAGPMKPITVLDCGQLPDDVLNGWTGGEGCDNCRICEEQISKSVYADPKTNEWTELEICPATNDQLHQPGGLCESNGGDATPTTSDGEGEPAPGLWKCMGSWTIEGTTIETNPPESEIVSPLSPDGVPVCVNATDASDATANCISYCNEVDQWYEDQAMNSDFKLWVPFPCDDLANFIPLATNDPSECWDGVPMNPQTPTPFAAEAILTLGDSSATAEAIRGSMQFSIGACSDDEDTCDLEVTELRAQQPTLHGEYQVTRSESLDFAVHGLETQMLQPLRGKLTRSSGAVSFAGERLFTTISVANVTLAGKPISAGHTRELFVVDDLSGAWDGQHLTLRLQWRSELAALTVALTGG